MSSPLSQRGRVGMGAVPFRHPPRPLSTVRGSRLIAPRGRSAVNNGDSAAKPLAPIPTFPLCGKGRGYASASIASLHVSCPLPCRNGGELERGAFSLRHPPRPLSTAEGSRLNEPRGRFAVRAGASSKATLAFRLGPGPYAAGLPLGSRAGPRSPHRPHDTV